VECRRPGTREGPFRRHRAHAISRQRSVSPLGEPGGMDAPGVEQLIRQAIGGDSQAVRRIRAEAAASDAPVLLVLATLLGVGPDGPALLERAAAAASTREDRQLVAIARAHIGADRELVDALARDHLGDFPGSYLVAWIASGAAPPAAGLRPSVP
jgi:hypothetical protein